MYDELNHIIQNAKHIVILQADNPDGDSLGSALALEAILQEMNKQTTLLCAVDMPVHLRYLDGWSRVQKEIPQQFDATIIVDTSSETLFEHYENDPHFSWIKTKPVVVIDHHSQTSGLSYATLTINENAVATSEILYKIAQDLSWPLPLDACNMLAVSIMSDSLGLVSEATSSTSIRTIAELVDKGVLLAELEEARRLLMKKEPELIPYKGELLQRVRFDKSGKIASIIIPWKEIEKYSPLYNPSMLVIDDMRMVVGVDVAIAYKVYRDGKITAKIRCNYGRGIGGELAAHFGGGGHPYASGFKIAGKSSAEELHKEVTEKALQLLDTVGIQNESI